MTLREYSIRLDALLRGISAAKAMQEMCPDEKEMWATKETEIKAKVQALEAEYSAEHPR